MTSIRNSLAHPQRMALILINIIGGVAVLGSYAYGIGTHPGTAGLVWGGVPEWLKPVYTASMLTAAAGYFPMTGYVLLALDPDRVRTGGGGRFGVFAILYLGILIPSALWMPLTFSMLDSPGDALWWTIRIVLFAVGGSSLGLLWSICTARPSGPAWAYGLAIVGAIAFCLQTAVLDALVWPAYFPR